MSRMIVNLYGIDPGTMVYWMFELKDDLTLRSIENTLRHTCPGDYDLVSWLNPDETSLERAFEVIMEFPDNEKRMEWIMRYA